MTRIGWACGLALVLAVSGGRAAESGNSWPVGGVNGAIGSSSNPASVCEIGLGSFVLHFT
jgi:hypothetical protein